MRVLGCWGGGVIATTAELALATVGEGAIAPIQPTELVRLQGRLG